MTCSFNRLVEFIISQRKSSRACSLLHGFGEHMIKYFQREWDKLSQNILKEYVISNNMKFPKEFLYICWKHRRLSEKKINTYIFCDFYNGHYS